MKKSTVMLQAQSVQLLYVSKNGRRSFYLSCDSKSLLQVSTRLVKTPIIFERNLKQI
jgi:hypothetical protein